MNPKDPNQPYGPVAVGDLELTVDRDGCIGAAACLAMATHTYAINDEGKAIVLDTADQDTEDALIDSMRACPVQAIKLRRISTGEDIA
jgi:ferredoxin